MLKDSRELKSYSESFKLKVLSELERGKYTKSEACRVYGIGSGSIYNWIKKYSRFDLLNKQVIVQTMDEKDKVKELEKELKQLRELLIDKDIERLTDKVYLDSAARQLVFKDAKEFKKKANHD